MSDENQIKRLEEELTVFSRKIDNHIEANASYPETNDEGYSTQKAAEHAVNDSDETCEADSEADSKWYDHEQEPTNSTLREVAEAEERRAKAHSMEIDDDDQALLQEVDDLDD